MSWISVLNETYNNNISSVGKSYDGEMPLLPVSHSTSQAQVEVRLDLDGNFIGATVVPKERADTIIPVSEDSCTRSSGIAPHPLCDKLCYIAGDYDKYADGKKPMAEYYNKYMEALEKWSKSEYSTAKVNCIYSYLSKRSIISDLIRSRLFETDVNGKLSSRKIEGVAQADCFVRFSIFSDCKQEGTWEDEELINAYIGYYNSTKSASDICYVSGGLEPVTDKYPAKIRHTGDKAKLISSNDNINFTYRGRFVSSNEVATVSYEVSQKAHNALKWLIAKQGYRNESNYIVVWNKDGNKIPTVYGGSDELLEDEDEPPRTAENYAKALNKAIAGYSVINTPKATIDVISVDTADGSTNGRLAIKLYTELSGSQFLANMLKWYDGCSWLLMPTKELPERVGTPSPKEIARAAYGVDRDGLLSVEPKLMKNTVERILPCIIQGKVFPKDIMLSAVQNVTMATSFSGYNHKRLLAVTCALIKLINNKGEEKTMGLNSDNHDRSYLFGRLLAIADVLEERTYEREEKRQTNAVRYWSTFAARPAKTWAIIMDRLRPYLDKSSSIVYYNRLLSEVHAMFGEGEFSDERLSPDYVLGYWCQRNDLYKKKDNVDIKEEEN